MSEVLRDLVVSLSLDGDNFSRNLTSINKQIQEAESEFRRAASGVENFEKSVSGTQRQLSSLQQKLELQQKAVKQYERALEAANKKLENAYARQSRLTESLDAAKQKNADLKQQVAAATKQYEHFSRELGESDSATLAQKSEWQIQRKKLFCLARRLRRLWRVLRQQGLAQHGRIPAHNLALQQ